MSEINENQSGDEVPVSDAQKPTPTAPQNRENPPNKTDSQTTTQQDPQDQNPDFPDLSPLGFDKSTQKVGKISPEEFVRRYDEEELQKEHDY